MTWTYRAGLICCLLTSYSRSMAAPVLRTVALSGQQAPGLPDGIRFDGFGYTLLNSAGQVAFSAGLMGDGVTGSNNFSVWSEDSGSLALAARTGDQAPDMPSGVTFSGFDDIAFGNGGHVAFPASVKIKGLGGRISTGGGLWSGRTGALRLVVGQGEQAPGAPSGVTVDIDNDPPVNSLGRTAFLTDLSGTGVDDSSDDAIWSDAWGFPTLIAREGEHAPGAPNGVNFGSFSRPAINSAGQVAFDATLSSRRPDHPYDTSIWLADFNSLEMVARTGDPAPGTSSGVSFDRFDPFPDGGTALSSGGQVGFSATLSGSGVDATNRHGIWSGAAGALRLVARAGDQAPGTSAGVNFRQVFGPAINAAGQMAFKANLSGMGVDFGNDVGIWSEGIGALALVAREGDHAPGTPDGVTFGSPDVVHFGFSQVAWNTAGQIAFSSLLKANGVIAGWGIWTGDRDGTLRLIVRDGNQFEVAPGDFRTVDEAGFMCCANRDEGHFNAFNARGELALHVSFTDGSGGIFVSSLAAVPEPNPLMLVAAAIIALIPQLNRIRLSRRSSIAEQ